MNENVVPQLATKVVIEALRHDLTSRGFTTLFAVNGLLFALLKLTG